MLNASKSIFSLFYYLSNSNMTSGRTVTSKKVFGVFAVQNFHSCLHINIETISNIQNSYKSFIFHKRQPNSYWLLAIIWRFNAANDVFIPFHQFPLTLSIFSSIEEYLPSSMYASGRLGKPWWLLHKKRSQFVLVHDRYKKKPDYYNYDHFLTNFQSHQFTVLIFP